MKLKNIFILSLFLFFTYCSGSGVGILVNKPTLPASNIFGDFDSNIPDTAIDTTTEESRSALTRKIAAIVLGNTTLEELYSVFTTRGNSNRKARSEDATNFGEQIVAATADQGVEEVFDTVQIVTLPDDADLYEEGDNWEVEMILDSNDNNYIRYTFRNTTEGVVQGTSVVKTNDSGTVLKGLFAYVDPTEGAEHRVVALAYDFTDSTNTLMVLRINEYFLSGDTYYSYQLHYQCNSSTGECIAEYLENTDGSLNDMTSRVAWNEETGSKCVAQMDYSGGTVVVGTTYSFTDSFADSNVSTGTCTLSTPHWGSHVFTTADLPDREGTTALEYYETGFNSLTPALIDTWLDASAF